MKFTIQKEDILPGLHQAAQITTVKTGAVFLRSVWFKAESGQLQIMATDSNIEFYGSYQAQIDNDGLVGVNGRHLYDLIRKLHPGELLFQVEEESKKLHVKQNKRKYVLPINENYWFQPLSTFPEEHSVFWHGESFSDVIDSVFFSISDDEVMRAINCMFVKFSEKEQKIDFCGLNGHQLALFQLEKNGLENIIPEQGILIMKKYLGDLRRMMPQKEIEINISNNKLYCRSFDKIENISIPLTQYDFPDHKELLAKYISDNPSSMNVDKKLLIDALDRISIFNTDNSICTYFEFSENLLQMDVHSDEKGEANEYIDVEFKGDLKKIAFPTKDIMEILSHFKSEKLHFHFTNSEGPCFVTGNEDQNYSVLIMPMKITEDVVYTEKDI
ncbi:MAG TPA: DNA polymerase III subunit beta [Desulfonatronum sp.]|nr:DNA polymerase III subunit beta [Desulfonatronum sp.]